MADLSDEDLEIVAGCAAAHPNQRGGQHASMPHACVLIIHKPTGIAVRVDSERSQHGNKVKAMEMLRGLLASMLSDEEREALIDARDCVSDSDIAYTPNKAECIAVLDKLLANDRPDGDR